VFFRVFFQKRVVFKNISVVFGRKTTFFSEAKKRDFFQKINEKIAQNGEFVHEFNELQQIFT